MQRESESISTALQGPFPRDVYRERLRRELQEHYDDVVGIILRVNGFDEKIASGVDIRDVDIMQDCIIEWLDSRYGPPVPLPRRSRAYGSTHR